MPSIMKYAIYYNEMRTHVSLGKDTPCTRPIERFGDVVAHPILGGLHHRYARIQISEATALISRRSSPQRRCVAPRARQNLKPRFAVSAVNPHRAAQSAARCIAPGPT